MITLVCHNTTVTEMHICSELGWNRSEVVALACAVFHVMRKKYGDNHNEKVAQIGLVSLMQ